MALDGILVGAGDASGILLLARGNTGTVSNVVSVGPNASRLARGNIGTALDALLGDGDIDATLLTAAAGGGSFVFTGSGGITFSGSATASPGFNFSFTAAGGAVFSGTAAATATYNFAQASSGGLQLGGAASATATYSYTHAASGGLQFGGSASSVLDVGFSSAGSGGIIFSGAATVSVEYPHIASGGLQFGGTAGAVIDAGFVVTGSGGLQFGGTATTSMTGAYAASGSGGLAFSGSAGASLTPIYVVAGSGGIVFGGQAAASDVDPVGEPPLGGYMVNMGRLLLRMPMPAAAAPGGGGGGLPFTIFFAENSAPSGSVTGAPVTERALFSSYLSGVSSEPFSGFALGSGAPVSVSANGTTCTIKQVSSEDNVDFTDIVEVLYEPDIGNSTAAQRFNTSGSGDRWLDMRVETGYDAGAASGIWMGLGVARFTFSTAVSAFGFYGTDFGDFAVNFAIRARLTDSSATVTTHIITDAATRPGGNLIFWGFIDSTNTYTQVEIFVDKADGESASEGLGIDDLVFCTPAYLAP